VAKVWRNRWAPRRVESRPAFFRAFLTRQEIATGLANSVNGARLRIKTLRLVQHGRPLRKCVAKASPTSAGKGNDADSPPFVGGGEK
jgi:hypothetical protein